MEKYKLVREIPVEKGYDIVIAGGGPAGTVAAITAARLGAKVLLAEAMGCLGGMGTSGQVAAFDPMADGERQLVRGVMGEILEKMYARGFLPPHVTPDFWQKKYHCWTPFHPEGLKLLLDEMTQEAGVEVRFFTRVIDADVTEGRVNGVVLQNVEGYSYVQAGAFIDCTGDAVLSDLCGAEYREAGRDTENIMPPTLTAVFSNIDWDHFDQLPHDDRYLFIEKAYEEGIISQCDRHLPGMWRIGKRLAYLNGGHIFRMNSVKCQSLSQGMMRGRQLVQEYAAMYRKYVKGCEDMELVNTSSLMGVRESRRIVGEYELTYADYAAKRNFPDQIGVFNKFVDIHVYDCEKSTWDQFVNREHHARLQPGEYFGIPYGILVPKGFKNLWVAGRCASSDVMVQGSIRVMPAAGMMGQAAATAAVQCMRTGCHAAEINTRILVETLRENGAFLPQEELSDTMTRS